MFVKGIGEIKEVYLNGVEAAIEMMEHCKEENLELTDTIEVIRNTLTRTRENLNGSS